MKNETMHKARRYNDVVDKRTSTIKIESVMWRKPVSSN